jgi:hypothetical protein
MRDSYSIDALSFVSVCAELGQLYNNSYNFIHLARLETEKCYRIAAEGNA